MVMTYGANGAGQRIGRAHAGGRHHDVLLDVLRGKLCELDRIEFRPGAAVEAPEQERERLAEMPERKLRARKAIDSRP